eukprot:jgi/Tetstr1/433415/TSEL_022689.t1
MFDGTWHGPLTGAEFTLKNTSFHRVAPLNVPSTVDQYRCYMEKGQTTIKPVDEAHNFKIAYDNPFSERLVLRYMKESNKDKVITKSGTREFQQIWKPAYARHVKDTLGDSHAVMINFGTQNNLVVNVDTESKILPLQNSILQVSKEKRLRKADGIVYEPINPCAYVQGPTYKKFISQHFGSSVILRENVDNIQKLEKFLTDYTDLEELPELLADRYLLSFGNGALDTKTMEFYGYTEMEEDPSHPARDRVARHHVDCTWT